MGDMDLNDVPSEICTEPHNEVTFHANGIATTPEFTTHGQTLVHESMSLGEAQSIMNDLHLEFPNALDVDHDERVLDLQLSYVANNHRLKKLHRAIIKLKMDEQTGIDLLQEVTTDFHRNTHDETAMVRYVELKLSLASIRHAIACAEKERTKCYKELEDLRNDNQIETRADII